MIRKIFYQLLILDNGNEVTDGDYFEDIVEALKVGKLVATDFLREELKYYNEWECSYSDIEDYDYNMNDKLESLLETSEMIINEGYFDDNDEFVVVKQVHQDGIDYNKKEIDCLLDELYDEALDNLEYRKDPYSYYGVSESDFH